MNSTYGSPCTTSPGVQTWRWEIFVQSLKFWLQVSDLGSHELTAPIRPPNCYFRIDVANEPLTQSWFYNYAPVSLNSESFLNIPRRNSGSESGA